MCISYQLSTIHYQLFHRPHRHPLHKMPPNRQRQNKYRNHNNQPRRRHPIPTDAFGGVGTHETDGQGTGRTVGQNQRKEKFIPREGKV